MPKRTHCKQCKKLFKYYADKIHKGKFCSLECYRKYRWGESHYIKKFCKECGASFMGYKSSKKVFCKPECRGKWISKNRCGINHPRFKYRIAYGKDGKYWAILQPHHPYADSKGYVMEHRLIMEKAINRFLQPSEVIHHKNGNTKNNKLDNLEYMFKKEHDRMHTQKRWDTNTFHNGRTS